jgi:phosphoribosyl-ATP pyrophosphohydrolase
MNGYTEGWFVSTLNLEEFEKLLNKLGEEGWELITSFDTNRNQGVSHEVIAILKRKRQRNCT